MTVAAPDDKLDRAHRALFGRLVGWLFRMTGDLQLAEDAVSAAFASAVPHWRASGVPDSPEAWLRVTARNAALSQLRRNSRAITVDPESLTDREAPENEEPTIDDRLALLFVCAHPAIDPRVHAPLMLQAVLGVDAARIASVFLVPPATMGQRLSRAKAKIRDAGITYRVPEPNEFAGRLGAVLQAVYAAYGVADSSADIADERDSGLRAEAVRLAVLLTELLPDAAETWGLAALLMHTQSRRPARIVEGEFVPLAAQDTELWTRSDRTRADEMLRRASAFGQPGRFQLEAAISAIHSARGDGIPTDWASIALLYRGLLQLAPSIGATIGAASALIEVGDVEHAEQLLDSVPADAVADHQPYWVCRARLCRVQDNAVGAEAAASRAIGLTSDPAVRRYLIASLR